MRRVYLGQVQSRYGPNVYLPYSVGLLWAYARTFPEVVETWELGGFLYMKEPVEKALTRLEGPDLVALSCYIWNWRWSLAFAEAVKARWPSCHVLVGGVQIPDESASTLVDHPFIDYAIYGEGEAPFVDLLRALAGYGAFSDVGSLVYRDGQDVRVTARREYPDVEALRSPYLDGVFEPILRDGWKWQMAQETNRGCPYACTFCSWGRSALDKIRPLPMDRVLAELEWASRHECAYVENCDANFGILTRDETTVEEMVRLKKETGYPQRFRAAWAKNSDDKMFGMASALHEADMLKAVTLSVQSMNDEVLTLTKRKNIKYDKLVSLLAKYEEAGIPTYTELIMGQPGETLESYIVGIDRLLDAGQHDGLFCYPCMLLPNTEMDTEAYKTAHGIRSVPMQAMLLHGVPEPDVIPEIQDIVIETASMCHLDWRRSYVYSWLIQAFHVCGLTQYMARRLRVSGLRYRDFYVLLLHWMIANPLTSAGREVVMIRDLLASAVAGGSWDLVDPRFGEVSWPPEEFSFLRCVCEADRFYDEIAAFVAGLPVERDGVARLVAEQRAMIVRPAPGHEEEFAREAVWYGRKGSGAKKRMAARPALEQRV